MVGVDVVVDFVDSTTVGVVTVACMRVLVFVVGVDCSRVQTVEPRIWRVSASQAHWDSWRAQGFPALRFEYERDKGRKTKSRSNQTDVQILIELSHVWSTCANTHHSID